MIFHAPKLKAAVVARLAATLFGCAVTALGQTPVTSPARSHVERFSSPEARAGRAETEATAKLAANPNDAEALDARSLARMQLGRYQEAYEDLRRAVALKPENADYRASLGYVLWKLGQVAAAVSAEREALKLDDNNFTAHYQLGRFLLRAGDPKQAMEAAAHLRRALEIEPRQLETRFELVAAYRALGDMEQAGAQLKVLQDARPSDPRVTYIAALLASDRGNLDEAINGFREALRRDPSLVGVRHDLGVAYVKQQRWAEAIDIFAELSRRQPDAGEAAYFHALALYNAGRAEEAEREARRALRLDEGAAAAHTLLGIILFGRGSAGAEARDALLQATALDAGSFDAHYYLGRVQGDTKDYTGAALSLSKAVSLNPRHQFARFLLGYALEMKGEFEPALAQYRELVKLDPDSAFGQMGLGALLVKQGKTDEAVTALKRAIALDNSLFEAHWSLGRALALDKRYAEAAESFREAIRLAPDRPDGHYQLGLSLQRLGRTDEAKREFDAAARITSSFRMAGAAEP